MTSPRPSPSESMAEIPRDSIVVAASHAAAKAKGQLLVRATVSVLTRAAFSTGRWPPLVARGWAAGRSSREDLYVSRRHIASAESNFPRALAVSVKAVVIISPCEKVRRR